MLPRLGIERLMGVLRDAIMARRQRPANRPSFRRGRAGWIMLSLCVPSSWVVPPKRVRAASTCSSKAPHPRLRLRGRERSGTRLSKPYPQRTRARTHFAKRIDDARCGRWPCRRRAGRMPGISSIRWY